MRDTGAPSPVFPPSPRAVQPSCPHARADKRHCLKIKLFFLMELRDLDDGFADRVDVFFLSCLSLREDLTEIRRRNADKRTRTV